MATDMNIHIFKNITEKDLAIFFKDTLGSKWFDNSYLENPPDPKEFWDTYSDRMKQEEKVWDRVSKTPSVWVGEVSWLKASLFEGDYIPDVVGEVYELIGDDLPVIDQEFISKVERIYKVAKGHKFYDTSSKDKVLKFLNENIGERCFTISW